MFRTNAIGALLVVSTLLSLVTSVSAFAATAITIGGPDGTAALGVFTGQDDEQRPGTFSGKSFRLKRESRARAALPS